MKKTILIFSIITFSLISHASRSILERSSHFCEIFHSKSLELLKSANLNQDFKYGKSELKSTHQDSLIFHFHKLETKYFILVKQGSNSLARFTFPEFREQAVKVKKLPYKVLCYDIKKSYSTTLNLNGTLYRKKISDFAELSNAFAEITEKELKRISIINQNIKPTVKSTIHTPTLKTIDFLKTLSIDTNPKDYHEALWLLEIELNKPENEQSQDIIIELSKAIHNIISYERMSWY